MFHALANGKIDTGRYAFEHELVDIETLNRRAFAGELELTAVSLHAYAYLTESYMLCPCGASMGDGYGPMVITRQPATIDDVRSRTIAVPGTLTTAFLALRMCLGKEFRHVVVPFDQIIEAVERGEYEGQPIEAGLIIHEGQLTYGDRGLKLVVDLGQWWMDGNRPAVAAGGQRPAQGFGRRNDPRRKPPAAREHRYGLDHRDEALAYALQYGRDLDHDGPTVLSACTSTIGRSISARAVARRSANCWPGAMPPA